MIKELQNLMDQVNRKLAEKGIQVQPAPQVVATPLMESVIPVETPELGSAVSGSSEIVNAIQEIAIQAPAPEVIQAAVPAVGPVGTPGLPGPDFPVGSRSISSVTLDAASQSAGHLMSLVLKSPSAEQALESLAARGIWAQDPQGLGLVTDVRATAATDETRLALHLGVLRDEIVRRFEELALKAKQQDQFAGAMKASWFMTREQGRALYKALRTTLGAEGRWPSAPMSKLAQDAEKMAEEKAARRMNPEKGVARKQLKKDNAVADHGELLVVAQRVAAELAVNGPITIDDVTEQMRSQYKVAPSENEEAQNWKGSVFGGAQWIKVGQMPSRLPEAHGRMVSLWALKSWLEENTMNGRSGVKSAFDLSRILSDFRRAHPGQDLKRCNFLIGDQRLSRDCRESIVAAQNKLYEIPVIFVAGGVGAMIMLPNYQAEQQKTV